MSDPLAGETVDTRYEIVRLIARGGMGLVLEARHRFTRRTVALKLLPDDLRHKKEARGRLMREAHALAAVRHPGFVEVLDAGVCIDHGPYVVLEMLDGRTLDGILASRRVLPVDDTIQLGRQICDAVAHAHARGVIHRDLKPSNVFIARSETGGEVVKLIDLGVASVGDEQLAQLDPKLTAMHQVLGTPEYMAPEQLWGKPVDVRTDVYSIGMTLYECLTGEVPYVGVYPEVLVQVAQATRGPDVRQKRADVPPAVAVVIENALEKDAASRFQSVLELGRALVASSGFAPGPSALLAASARHVASVGDPDDDVPARAIKLVRRKAPRVPTDSPSGDLPPSSQATPPMSTTSPGPLSHKRQFRRAPYVTPVLLISPSGSEVEARSEEISEEGVLVLTPRSFPLGARLTLRFASPTSGDMVVLEGTVRWTREARERSALGVEFTSVPPLLRRVVADYMAAMAS